MLAKTIALTLLIFVGLGFGLYRGLIWVGTEMSWRSDGYIEAVGAALLALLMAWLLFRVVALAVLQVFADEIVAAVEQKHYPQAAKTAKALPLPRDLANSLKGAGRALFYNALALPVAGLLLFTAIGPAVVFLLVNAVLLGRELTDMAWLRQCEGDIGGNPVPSANRVMLGGAVAGLRLLPFVNLVAPVIGAAAGNHVMHSAKSARAKKDENRA